MKKLSNLKPARVFYYFEEISQIPRGSGNMDAISSYCMEFARTHNLKAFRDDANNVVIFKKASAGYESAEPVILQGHLDMVCQKEETCNIDFEKDGLSLYVDGNFLKADGTTLGADNGIAVAMILAILESDTIVHPPIEALFTTDEEIGMIGASAFSTDCLHGKRMFNLDSEEPGMATVSCAGGSDLQVTLPVVRKTISGEKVTINLKGLQGGHSGVLIGEGRVNADILAGRVLQYAKQFADFELISINGGDKGNAIPLACTIEVLVQDAETFTASMEEYFATIQKEIAQREPNFAPTITRNGIGEYAVLDADSRDKLIYMLLCAPNGVMDMSAEIENLVETSLNLGILKTEPDSVFMHFTLRSNKKSALEFLEQKLKAFLEFAGGSVKTFGHYPPWEFKENSTLQKIYKETFREMFGYEPAITAIHAGLECGVFSGKIDGLDCISIGPEMYDVHTTGERLSISSTEETYSLLLKLLEQCK